jgi:hypothetical protein
VISVAGGLTYSPSTGWPLLAEALRQAEEGNSVAFLSLLGVINNDNPPPPRELTNQREAFDAISCVDIFTFTSLPEWDRLYADAVAAAPHFGAQIATRSALPCAAWPQLKRRAAAPIVAHGAPPILVVGTTNDPATPYRWAVGLSSELESSVLLTYHGEGHTAYALSNHCIDGGVDAYLIELQMPAAGTVCEPEGEIPHYNPAPAPAPAVVSDANVPPASSTPRAGIMAPDTGTGTKDGSSAQFVEVPVLALLSGMILVAAGRAVRPRQ